MGHQTLLPVEWLRQETIEFFITLKTLLLAKPIIIVSATTLIGYIVWYRVSAVRRPLVYCKEGSRLQSFLLESCDVLSQRYWPTLWAVNCHVCTIFRSKLQSAPRHLKYERYVEIVSIIIARGIY